MLGFKKIVTEDFWCLSLYSNAALRAAIILEKFGKVAYVERSSVTIIVRGDGSDTFGTQAPVWAAKFLISKNVPGLQLVQSSMPPSKQV